MTGLCSRSFRTKIIIYCTQLNYIEANGFALDCPPLDCLHWISNLHSLCLVWRITLANFISHFTIASLVCTQTYAFSNSLSLFLILFAHRLAHIYTHYSNTLHTHMNAQAHPLTLTHFPHSQEGTNTRNSSLSSSLIYGGKQKFLFKHKIHPHTLWHTFSRTPSDKSFNFLHNLMNRNEIVCHLWVLKLL